MQNRLKEVLQKEGFEILKEISKDTVYSVLHPLLQDYILFISLIENKILFSVNVGELKKENPAIIDREPEYYCQKLIKCWKNAKAELYEPLKAMEESLEYRVPTDKDFYYVEFNSFELLFTKEFDLNYHILNDQEIILLNVHRVNTNLLFDFTFNISVLSSKIDALHKYFSLHKYNIINLIK
ncbi:hypothetical protein JHD46_06320 [Sulfurimonas sp. SAG-AH-194-C20]|nr:hypothetical protein [Sulfurimonas sp. SAG-AH-194-C20]MDF1879252.1 hypothetical protein [Sulfurimonas sp. SAG-AH-194-C20]